MQYDKTFKEEKLAERSKKSQKLCICLATGRAMDCEINGHILQVSEAGYFRYRR